MAATRRADPLDVEHRRDLGSLPGLSTHELATAIDALPDLAEDNLLSGVAASSRPTTPSTLRPRRPRAPLISRYLYCQSGSTLRPGGAVRAAPDRRAELAGPGAVREVLGDIRGYSDQWVSVLNAVRVIDIADTVACGPLGDATGQFRHRTAGPLNGQKSRLSATLRGWRRSVADELDLGLDWQVARQGRRRCAGSLRQPRSWSRGFCSTAWTPARCARVKDRDRRQWPKALVVSSRRQGRERCAEAARAERGHHRAGHPPGGARGNGLHHCQRGRDSLIALCRRSGSASMLRAVESAIGEWSELTVLAQGAQQVVA